MRTAHRIGNDADGHAVFVQIEIEDKPGKGKVLSISGTCANGGGQIIEAVRDVQAFATGWDSEKRDRLADIWDRYHLNDMQAGCEHQRGWDTGKRIVTETYSIDWDVRRAIERQHEKALEAIGLQEVGKHPDARHPVPHPGRKRIETFSPAGDLLYRLEAAGIKPFAWTTVKDSRTLAVVADGFEIIGENDRKEMARYAKEVDDERHGQRRAFKGQIKPVVLKRTRSEYAANVRHTEHPDGLLCKPCETCGYKYGSEWRFEQIPQDVLDWLASLNGTTESPYDIIAREFLETHGLTFNAEHKQAKRSTWCKQDEDDKARHWRITIAREDGRTLEFDFWGSIADAEGNKDVKPYAVLACLSADSFLSDDADELAEELGLKPSQAFKAAQFGEEMRAFFGQDLADLRGIS